MSFDALAFSFSFSWSLWCLFEDFFMDLACYMWWEHCGYDLLWVVVQNFEFSWSWGHSFSMNSVHTAPMVPLWTLFMETLIFPYVFTLQLGLSRVPKCLIEIICIVGMPIDMKLTPNHPRNTTTIPDVPYFEHDHHKAEHKVLWPKPLITFHHIEWGVLETIGMIEWVKKSPSHGVWMNLLAIDDTTFCHPTMEDLSIFRGAPRPPTLMSGD